MDLFAPLLEPPCPLVHSHGIQDRWSLRAELGDAAIQMLDLADYYILPARYAPESESVLAILPYAQRLEILVHWREEG